jgi:hypothetical protein
MGGLLMNRAYHMKAAGQKPDTTYRKQAGRISA